MNPSSPLITTIWSPIGGNNLSPLSGNDGCILFEGHFLAAHLQAPHWPPSERHWIFLKRVTAHRFNTPRPGLFARGERRGAFFSLRGGVGRPAGWAMSTVVTLPSKASGWSKSAALRRPGWPTIRWTYCFATARDVRDRYFLDVAPVLLQKNRRAAP